MTKLFVYGSLKRGEPLSQYLPQATFLREGQISGVLFDLGAFPAAIEVLQVPVHIRSQTNGVIKGEIYQLPGTNIIRALDQIEGHPHFYRRELIPELTTGKDVWAYLLPWNQIQHRKVTLLPEGIWTRKKKNPRKGDVCRLKNLFACFLFERRKRRKTESSKKEFVSLL